MNQQAPQKNQGPAVKFWDMILDMLQEDGVFPPNARWWIENREWHARLAPSYTNKEHPIYLPHGQHIIPGDVKKKTYVLPAPEYGEPEPLLCHRVWNANVPCWKNEYHTKRLRAVVEVGSDYYLQICFQCGAGNWFTEEWVPVEDLIYMVDLMHVGTLMKEQQSTGWLQVPDSTPVVPDTVDGPVMSASEMFLKGAGSEDV